MTRMSHNFTVRTDFETLHACRRILEAIDTPVSLSCYLLLKYGEHDQLAEKSLSPLDYVTPASFLLDAQAIACTSKYPHLNTSWDRKAVAFKKFLQAEESCKETNLWFDQLMKVNDLPELHSIFHRMKLKIDQILGPCPSFSELDCRFGPGASVGVRGETSAYNKVSSTFECTKNMLPILGDLLRSYPSSVREGPLTVNIVEGSELTFVPKNAKTDRPICIEPTLNGFLQKGIGSFMRSRLREFGINLNSQGTNQRLASLAFERQLATVDFSSASDTISYRLVEELLPRDWFELLDCCRCERFMLVCGGESCVGEFEKFSSMGNAYTFELETLIFFALAHSVMSLSDIRPITGYNLTVYGDDVILPQSAFALFSKASKMLGFSVNEEKSFSSGSFFESCGEDFFESVNVRPFFIKKKIFFVDEGYYLANSLLSLQRKLWDSWSSKNDSVHLRKVLANLSKVHAFIIKSIPSRFRLLTPYGAGDVGLTASFDVAKPSRKHRGAHEGYRYKQVVQSPRVKKIDGDVSLFYALYHIKEDPGVSASHGVNPATHYTVRGGGNRKIKKSFWQAHWPEAPWMWGPKSLSLVRSTA